MLQKIIFSNKINFSIWVEVIKTIFKERFSGHKKQEVLVSIAIVEVVRVVCRCSFIFLQKDFTINNHISFCHRPEEL